MMCHDCNRPIKDCICFERSRHSIGATTPPTPRTDDEVFYRDSMPVVEADFARQLERELAAVTKERDDNAKAFVDCAQKLAAAKEDADRLLNVARGCHDYNGGHRDKDAKTYHHGIQTVINALEAAAKKDPNDTQVNALAAIGNAAHRKSQP